MVGVLLLGVAFFPGFAEEGHEAAFIVFDEEGVGGLLEGFGVADEPGGGFEGLFGEVSVDSVFVFQAILHHFELELADGGVDGVAEHVEGLE